MSSSADSSSPLAKATVFGDVAAVLPRYGEGLGGGAETLVKSLLEAGLRFGLFRSATVFTTCALDHRSWQNVLPAGESQLGGVSVNRFPVDERDLGVFISCERAMQEGRSLTVDDQLAWLSQSVNSAALSAELSLRADQFEFIFFAPYLFATTFWGALIAPERSVIIPCLHNEHYAYQDVFHYLLKHVAGIIFNSLPEQQLCEEICAVDNLLERSEVVGMGFEAPTTNVELETLPASVGPQYLLYSGRKEQGKGLDVLLSNFEKFNQESVQKLQLVLIGAGEVHFMDQLPVGVIDLGFVSEELKFKLMSKAVALVQPSTNESFSIVLMESWLQKTAVLVNGACSVTRHHAQQAGGGLFFSSFGEFKAAVDLLCRDAELRQNLGQAGYDYVQQEYSWPAVIGRLKMGLLKISGRNQLHATADQPALSTH